MIENLLDLARAHGPLLVVVLPFFGAAAALALGRSRASWVAATITATATAVLAVTVLAHDLMDAGVSAPVVEALPINPDALGLASLALIAIAGCLVQMSAISFITDYEAGSAPFAVALVLCMQGGWSGAAVARDFTSLFLFVEVSWFASVGLVALSSHRHRGALNGALRMLFSGAVASAILLLGVALAERGLGGAISDFASQRISAPNISAIAVTLIFVALSWRAGLAPFNTWAGVAYGRGGGLVAMALGAVGMTGAALALARLATAALPAPAIAEGVGLALAALGVAGASFGSVQAIGATSVWRLAGYASAAQLGCALLGMGLGSPAGLEGALVQLTALIASIVALIASAALGRVDGSLDSLNGLGRRAPIAGAVMTAAALSLMGAPLTLSFLGKWLLVEAALGVGWWWAAGAAIAASLAASYYGGHLIERIYFRRATQAPLATGRQTGSLALAPAIIAAVLAIFSAIDPTIVLGVAGAASRTLVERGQ